MSFSDQGIQELAGLKMLRFLFHGDKVTVEGQKKLQKSRPHRAFNPNIHGL